MCRVQQSLYPEPKKPAGVAAFLLEELQSEAVEAGQIRASSLRRSQDGVPTWACALAREHLHQQGWQEALPQVPNGQPTEVAREESRARPRAESPLPLPAPRGPQSRPQDTEGVGRRQSDC